MATTTHPPPPPRRRRPAWRLLPCLLPCVLAAVPAVSLALEESPLTSFGISHLLVLETSVESRKYSIYATT